MAPRIDFGPSMANLPRVRGLLGCLALALAASCGAANEGPPNVVLLVLDTVRADHLSCYGYGLPTTPSIDALAARADRYARAESTAPWTLPSHASMFTGRYPFQHGVHSGRAPDGRIFDGRALAPANKTLAEALVESGYRTAGFVANNVYLSETFGIHQGFELYDVDRKRAPKMVAKLFDWIDAEPGGEPFFGFVNMLDAHRPYNVDPLPEGRAGQLPPPASEGSVDLLKELYDRVLVQGETADPELVAKIITQYDNGIGWLDLAVGQVVRGLEQRGLYENTLLIVTSDHGEYFGEHALVEHSKDVYEPAMSIPLIVKRPGQTAGSVIPERATLVDLPGLVFQSLPERLRDEHGSTFQVPDARRPVLAENHFTRPKDMQKSFGARFMRERAVLYAGRWKLILSSDGKDELYDLEADPGEATNLVAEHPEVVAPMRERLEALLSTAPAPNTLGAPPTLTDEQLDDLRDLGYVGD